MSHKLELFHCRDFLRTTPAGLLDLESSKRVLAEVAKAARGMSECHVLIDIRDATVQMSTFEVWELAAELEPYKRSAGEKTAVLVRPSPAWTGFFILCAQNRGICIEG